MTALICFSWDSGEKPGCFLSAAGDEEEEGRDVTNFFRVTERGVTMGACEIDHGIEEEGIDRGKVRGLL